MHPSLGARHNKRRRYIDSVSYFAAVREYSPAMTPTRINLPEVRLSGFPFCLMAAQAAAPKIYSGFWFFYRRYMCRSTATSSVLFYCMRRDRSFPVVTSVSLTKGGVVTHSFQEQTFRQALHI